MTDHFRHIYTHEAERYDRMVSREDQHGHLFAALMEIAPLQDAVVVDLGAGTGRVTRLMTFLSRQVIALDVAPAMLRVAHERLSESGMLNWSLAVADNVRIPLATNSAQVAVEGWSFGHAVSWYPDDWRAQISGAIDEMTRVVAPGGVIILIETLGTGVKQPEPPHEGLAEMYRWLEQDLNFSHRWVRTDYQFESVEEADELTRFFFGDELADGLVNQQKLILPECTGIWWREVT